MTQISNCPQDAYLDGTWENFTLEVEQGVRCGEMMEICKSTTIMVCTRTKGHTGDHHAHSTDGICAHVWANKNDITTMKEEGKMDIPKGVLDLF